MDKNAQPAVNQRPSILLRSPGRLRRTWLTIALLGLFAAGLAASLYSTASGIGLESDSFVYTAAARSLLDGRGYRIPVSQDVWARTAHFPPLYPALITGASLLGGEPLETARLLNAVFFGANLALGAYIVFRATRGSMWAAVIAAVLMAGAEGWVLIHAHLWSEPTFLFFTLLALAALAAYLHDPQIGLLATAAGFSALAFLTRYIGAVLIATSLMVLLLQRDRSLKARVRPMLAYFVVSAVPGALWLADNYRTTGSFTNRQFGSHWIGSQELLAGARAALHWFVPGRISDLAGAPVQLGMMLAALALLTVPLMLTFRPPAPSARQPGEAPGLSVVPFGIFSVVYVLFLLVSMSLFDAQTSLDTRILSAALVTGTIAALPALLRMGSQAPARLLRPLQWLLAFYLIAFAMSGWAMVRNLQAGRDKGYASPAWTESKLVNQIRGLPEDTLIYSNAQDVIFLLAGRTSASLPRMLNPNSLAPNPDYAAELAEMERRLGEEDAVVVVFDVLADRRHYLPSEKELSTRLELVRLSRWRDEGSLYRLAPQ